MIKRKKKKKIKEKKKRKKKNDYISFIKFLRYHAIQIFTIGELINIFTLGIQTKDV